MDRRAARLNRLGLTVLGLVLLAAGGLALARSLGAFGEGAAGDPVLAPGVRDFAADQGWFWPVLGAAGVVLALLGLAWLLAQGRSERLHGLTMEAGGPDEGATRLPAKVVAAAVERDVNGLPGVDKATARLLGGRDHPRLLLNVAYSSHADLASLRRHLTEEVLPRVRTALEREKLPAMVRLRLTTSPRPRTLA